MSRSHLAAKIPRQQVFNIPLFVTVNDSGEDTGDVSVRFDGVQFTGFDQRSEHGPVLGTSLMACEQGVFTVQGDGADSALDGVIVDLDASVG